MREILFRGRRTDNGEWETGSLVIIRGGCYDEEMYIADKMTGYNTPIIPDTVGQYTGLTDKNGVKIFEGDIVRVKYTCSNGGEATEIVAVQYDETNCCFYPMRWNESCEWCDYSTEIKEIEVIGNIHDNPELLKGGADNE